MRSFRLPVLGNDLASAGANELRITGVGIDETDQPNAPDREGSVHIDGSSLLYTPAYQEGGIDGSHFVESFTYVVGEGTDLRAEARVTLTVLARQDVRAAETNADHFTVAADSGENILDVLANDGAKPADASAWVVVGLSGTEVFSVQGGDAGQARIGQG